MAALKRRINAGSLLAALSCAVGCSKHASDPVRADTAGASGGASGLAAASASTSKSPLGPDSRAICRAAESADAGTDKWDRFGSLIPVFRGGWLLVLDGRAAVAEGVLAPFSLRDTSVIDCGPGGVVMWLPAVTLTLDGGSPDPLEVALEHGGLRMKEALEFDPSAGNRWRDNVCRDAEACCRLVRLRCRFDAKTEHDASACIQAARRDKAPIDPSCQ